MRQLRAWLVRLISLLHGERRNSELATELETHLRLHIEDNLRSGMTPEEARRRALVKLGGLDQTREDYRDRSGIPILESVVNDLRHSARALRRSPAFAVVALASLALGIGANSAIFNTANAMLWRPLPVSNPQSLVLFKVLRKDRGPRDYLPVALADELQKQSGVFSDVVTRDDDGLSFSFDGGRAERIVGEVDSPSYFVALGVKPIVGRVFSDRVQDGDWAAEAVLSYRFWMRRFGGDPHVIGRTILLNDYPFSVVGVTPPSFYGLEVGADPELRMPRMPRGQKLSQIALVSPEYSQIVGRLNAGVRIQQAQAALEPVFQTFLHDHPDLQSQMASSEGQPATNNALHFLVLPGDKGSQDGLVGFRQPLFLLLGLAGLVLLIACTNLASMLLARVTSRRRELAVRSALGASRVRLVRQMLVESLLLAALGGALGFVVATWVGGLLFAFLPQGHIATVLNLAPDASSVWFTIGLALISALITGLAPALRATGGDIVGYLKSDSAASIGGGPGLRMRRSLVVVQIAFSLLVLTMAALFQQTLNRLRTQNPFPRPDRVLLFTLKPQQELYDAGHMLNLTAQLERQIFGLSGVKSVGLAENGPLGSRRGWSSVEGASGTAIRADFDRVSPGYFETIGSPLIGGREFSPTDNASSQPVAVVNDVLARLLFQDQNPLGKSVLIRSEGNVRPLQIVGVVRATRYYDLHLAPPPAIFTDIQQDRAYMPTLHVRMADDDQASVVAAVLREFNSIDTGFPVFNIRTLADRLNDSLASERLLSELAAVFGALALLLAVAGIYGVMSYSVARRGREIGIRMALGASSGSVLALVVKETVALLLAGIAIGLPATAVAALVVSRQLSGAGKLDPATAIAATALMFAVALLAGLLPARRASRVDPLVALHYE